MKIHLLLLLVILSLNSCIKDKESTSRNMHNTIKNASSHDIRIDVNYKTSNDSILIPIGDFKEYIFLNVNGSTPLPFTADSLIVFYNDTLSIIHFKIDRLNVSRNIYSDKYWQFSMIEDDSYYEYVFTDEDYQEALDKQ